MIIPVVTQTLIFKFRTPEEHLIINTKHLLIKTMPKEGIFDHI